MDLGGAGRTKLIDVADEDGERAQLHDQAAGEADR
jgi:hypothetical protein